MIRAIDGTSLDRPDLATGDPRTVFGRLFELHAGPLRGYLAGRVGADTAEDLVAETFVVAFRRRDSYDPRQAEIRGWLYGIASNLLRNHVRQEIRGYQLSARAGIDRPVADGLDTAVAERVDAAARMRMLAGHLASLSEQERDVLLLTSWAGLEPTEVAVALNIPASTVRSRLHRVRQKLQALLTEGNQ